MPTGDHCTWRRDPLTRTIPQLRNCVLGPSLQSRPCSEGVPSPRNQGKYQKLGPWKILAGKLLGGGIGRCGIGPSPAPLGRLRVQVGPRDAGSRVSSRHLWPAKVGLLGGGAFWQMSWTLIWEAGRYLRMYLGRCPACSLGKVTDEQCNATDLRPACTCPCTCPCGRWK